MSALTFGIELEFNVAAILDPNIGHADPSEKRFVHFIAEERDRSPPRCGAPPVTYKIIARHIAQTLKDAGFNCDPNNPERREPTYWTITTDSSVEPPTPTPSSSSSSSSSSTQQDSTKQDLLLEDTRYTYFPIEIISPPIWFLRSNLPAISILCDVLKNTYCININRTCGLHVHVGDGDFGFDGIFLSRLFAFLWAFEPLLNQLHPNFRFDAQHCSSLRSSSNYGFDAKSQSLHVVSTSRIARVRRRTMEGISYFLSLKTIPELVIAGSDRFHRGEAVNVRNLLWWYEGTEGAKPTVEWRQHEGTLEGERIKWWVEVVCGIVGFLLRCGEVRFVEFLERFVEDGGGEVGVDGREREREKECSVLDLLRGLGLARCAEFYRGRLFEVVSSESSDSGSGSGSTGGGYDGDVESEGEEELLENKGKEEGSSRFAGPSRVKRSLGSDASFSQPREPEPDLDLDPNSVTNEYQTNNNQQNKEEEPISRTYPNNPPPPESISKYPNWPPNSPPLSPPFPRPWPILSPKWPPPFPYPPPTPAFAQASHSILEMLWSIHRSNLAAMGQNMWDKQKVPQHNGIGWRTPFWDGGGRDVDSGGREGTGNFSAGFRDRFGGGLLEEGSLGREISPASGEWVNGVWCWGVNRRSWRSARAYSNFW